VPVPFLLVALALLTVGAWRDIATRTIPDTVSLLLLALGGLARISAGWSAIFLSVVTAVALFILLLIAFSRGLIGGGDVKLMTALVVGLSPFDSYRFVVATAIAGGLLGLVYLLLRRMPRFTCQVSSRSLRARILTIESWRIRRHGPLPYGVAIAAGGAYALLLPGTF
jgi:prepilin peptidase CpaA